MKPLKTIWTSLTGSFTSTAPVLLACCKSGACIGVCAAPVASLFGISSASLAASPLMNVLEPLLIAVGAVAFTMSYYSLYVIPAAACATPSCSPSSGAAEKVKNRGAKIIFWTGLILSIGFLSYFQYDKYLHADNNAYAAGSCAPGACEEGDGHGAAACGESEDEACCEEDVSEHDGTAFACKLSPEELSVRKTTVIAELKNMLLEKEELRNGYAFKFSGEKAVLDKLNQFIESERSCCGFLEFELSSSSDGSYAWLKITGAEGVREFIAGSIGL
jgi:hypothetical protein